MHYYRGIKSLVLFIGLTAICGIPSLAVIPPLGIKDLGKADHTIPTTIKIDLNQVREFMPYVLAADCDIAMVQNWNCPVCLSHPYLRLSDVMPLTKSDGTASGYIGYSSEGIVLALKSHQSLSWLNGDLDSSQTNYNLDNGMVARINVGFNNAADDLLEKTSNHLINLRQKYPSAKVIVGGYSDAGAIASLLLVKLEASGAINWSIAKLITFGQPRVGDQVFADFMNTRTGLSVVRIVAPGDGVANSPARAFGYSHFAYEVLIQHGQVVPCSGEIDSCTLGYTGPQDSLAYFDNKDMCKVPPRIFSGISGTGGNLGNLGNLEDLGIIGNQPL